MHQQLAASYQCTALDIAGKLLAAEYHKHSENLEKTNITNM